MQLCSVEHKLNTSSTFFSSKLDSPSPMFWLEKNLILSNVLITGESNFDEKKCQRSVQHVCNWTELHTFWNYLLQNWYFNQVCCFLNHRKDQLSLISSCYVNLIRSKGHIKSTKSKGSEGLVGSTGSTALISKIDVFGLEFFWFLIL